MQSCVEIGLASFTYQPNQQTEVVFSNVNVSGGNGGFVGEDEGVQNIDTNALAGLSNDRHAAVSVNVAPNPAPSHFTLQLNEPLQQQATVEVLSSYGQLIAQQQLEAGQLQQQWNTSDLPTGTYLIRVNIPNQQPLMKKFVVAR